MGRSSQGYVFLPMQQSLQVAYSEDIPSEAAPTGSTQGGLKGKGWHQPPLFHAC